MRDHKNPQKPRPNSSIARTHLGIIDSNIHNYPSETLFKQTHFVQFPISYAVTFGGYVRMRHKVFTNELYNPNSEQFKSMEKYVCDAVSTVKIESFAFSFSWLVFWSQYFCSLQLEVGNQEQKCAVTRFRWVLYLQCNYITLKTRKFCWSSLKRSSRSLGPQLQKIIRDKFSFPFCDVTIDCH